MVKYCLLTVTVKHPLINHILFDLLFWNGENHMQGVNETGMDLLNMDMWFYVREETEISMEIVNRYYLTKKLCT